MMWADDVSESVASIFEDAQAYTVNLVFAIQSRRAARASVRRPTEIARLNHNAEVRAYYRRHAEDLKAKRRAHYAANRDRLKAAQLKRYHAGKKASL